MSRKNIDRSRVHEDMVQRLAVAKLPGRDRSLFPTIRELLCFAALLGYSEKQRVHWIGVMGPKTYRINSSKEGTLKTSFT